jgi:hypothetical protein
MAVRFQQGEDSVIVFELFKDGVVFDVTPSSDIRVKITSITGNVQTNLQRYSIVSQAGYGVCRKVSGANNTNKVEVIVERLQSINFPKGAISANILVATPNVNFPSGNQHEEFNFPSFGYIDEGQMKDEPIPVV